MTGTNSAQGGLTNVNWSKYDLRYQVAVYSEDGATLLVAPQTQVVDTYGPVSFEFRLTPNKEKRPICIITRPILPIFR